MTQPTRIGRRRRRLLRMAELPSPPDRDPSLPGPPARAPLPGPAHGRLPVVGKSSITILLDARPGTPFALALGATIRCRRLSADLSQEELGHPLTKGFVSQVERGRALPSIGALLLFANRLDVSPAALLPVAAGGSGVYTAVHADTTTSPGRRRRQRPGERDRGTAQGRAPQGRPDPATAGRGPLHEGLRERPGARPREALDGGAQLPLGAARRDRPRSVHR